MPRLSLVNMLLAVVWASIISQVWALQVTTVFGPHTPADVRDQFSAALYSRLSGTAPWLALDLQYITLPAATGDWAVYESVELLIDASFDLLLRAEVAERAAALFIPALSLSTGEGNMEPLTIRSIHSASLSVASALAKLLITYSWTSVTLLTSASEGANKAAELLEKQSNAKVAVYSLPDDAASEVVDSLLAKEIKVWSSPIVICTAGTRVCGNAVKSAGAHNMVRAGFAYVLTAPESLVRIEGGLRNSTIGVMYLTDSEAQEAKNDSEFHAFRAAHWIAHLARLGDSLQARNFALSPISDFAPFELWNTKDSGTEHIGDVSNTDFTATAVAVFPGNTTAVPVVKKPLIELSIDWDLTNPTTPPNTPYSDYFLAAYLAFREINERPDILPSHDLIWHNVTYGATEFNEKYVTQRLLENRHKLGIAHMAPIGSGVAMGVQSVMKKQGITLPVIGSVNSGVPLFNSTVYPYYVRTIVSNGYGATVYMTMFRYIGWKKINVIYGNETYGKDFYSNILRIAKIYGIEIANREELRMIDPGVNNATIGKFKEHLQEIIDTNVRPLLCGLLLPTPTYVFQGLYDLGARAGDIIYFGDLSTGLFTSLPPENATKSLEIGLGGIQLTSATYTTAVGESAFSHFVKLFGHNPISNSCFYYDAAYALAYTLKLLIRMGLNYEDPNVFMKVLRGTQFRGCSGVVAFEAGSNDRSFPGYVVVNIQGNLENLQLIQTGFYTPTSVKIFDFKLPIMWPGNVTANPTAEIQNTIDCPFKERELHAFSQGLTLTSILCVVIAVIISLLSLAIYAKFWRRSVPPLVEKANISVDDVLLMVSIVLEAFQYSALGPNFNSVNEALFELGEAMSVNLSNLVVFSKGVYWVCLDVVLSTCGIWLLLVIYVFLRLDDRLRTVFCIGNLGWIAWLLLPYLGNLCFLPIVSILLDVFVCDQGVALYAEDVHFHDSILARDCYVKCWQGDHIYYVAMCLAGLLIYAPLAVLLRPMWQEFQGVLHIKTAPSHFLVKTVFQILIIGLSKSLKREDQLAHGILYLFLLLLYILFEFRKDRFNYGRIAHWHRMSLLCVFWLGFLALLGDNYPLHSGYWALVTATGWGVIGLFGVIRMLQKYPSMLYRAKGLDTQKLFRFAFTLKDSRATVDFITELNKRKRTTFTTTEHLPNLKLTDQ